MGSLAALCLGYVIEDNWVEQETLTQFGPLQDPVAKWNAQN
jgi:hypothetical protein